MIQAITVTPQAEGWCVTSDAFDSDFYFDSGAKAEAAARQMAGELAARGETVALEIYLRDGALAGRIDCKAAVGRKLGKRVAPRVF